MIPQLNEYNSEILGKSWMLGCEQMLSSYEFKRSSVKTILQKGQETMSPGNNNNDDDDK